MNAARPHPLPPGLPAWLEPLHNRVCSLVEKLPATPPSFVAARVLNQLLLPRLPSDARAAMTGRCIELRVSDLGLRVPADLSLVGYDDIPLASYLTPRLTTSSKDMVKVGREAAKMLLARIQDPDRPYQRVDVQARFIIRESTGPAPSY